VMIGYTSPFVSLNGFCRFVIKVRVPAGLKVLHDFVGDMENRYELGLDVGLVDGSWGRLCCDCFSAEHTSTL